MLIVLSVLGFLFFVGCFFRGKMYISMQVIMILVVMLFTNIKICLTPYSVVSLIGMAKVFSVVMIVLSFWVVGMMFLVSLSYFWMYRNSELFTILLLTLLMIMVLFFLTDNFLILYIMFEASLIPTFLLILKWGYQPERLLATFYFVMYTVCASLPFLFVLMKLKVNFFSLSMFDTFPMALINISFSYELMYLSFILAFLVKVPMWGFHLWLPKAHVEAPVSGSMILAGILLKLGGYGLIQVICCTYKIKAKVFSIVYGINLWSALLVSLVCLVSMDIKCLIAYSSIVHMSMMIVGIMKESFLGILGSFFMMIAHGLCSPGMFAMANLNYEIVHTRNLLLQKGLSLVHPVLMFMWFIVVVANMGGPPSLNLASEIFISVSVLKMSFCFSIIIGLVTFFSASYNLYLYSSYQSNKVKFIISGKSLHSSNILMGVCHCVSVYLLILVFFYIF